MIHDLDGSQAVIGSDWFILQVPNDPMIPMSPLQVGHWTHWTLLHFRRFGGENGPIHGIHESTSFSYHLVPIFHHFPPFSTIFHHFPLVYQKMDMLGFESKCRSIPATQNEDGSGWTLPCEWEFSGANHHFRKVRHIADALTVVPPFNIWKQSPAFLDIGPIPSSIWHDRSSLIITNYLRRVEKRPS